MGVSYPDSSTTMAEFMKPCSPISHIRSFIKDFIGQASTAACAASAITSSFRSLDMGWRLLWKVMVHKHQAPLDCQYPQCLLPPRRKALETTSTASITTAQTTVLSLPHQPCFGKAIQGAWDQAAVHVARNAKLLQILKQ